MLRILQSIVVTAFFGVMMFLLARDHVLPNWNRGEGIEVDRAVLADSWANQDEFMEIRLGDQVLGAVRTTAERESAEDAYSGTTHLKIGTGVFNARLMAAMRMNRRLELEHGRVRVNVPPLGGRLLTPAELEAETLPRDSYEMLAMVEGADLAVLLRSQTGVRHLAQRLARPITIADSITPILSGRMLTRNVVYAIDIYDPFFGTNAGKAELEWVGEEMRVIDGEVTTVRQVELRANRATIRIFVDKDGRVLKREIPLLAPGPTAATAAAGTTDPNAPVISLVRMEPMAARAKYPDLEHVPTLVTVSRADVTGKDSGELLKGFGLFSLLGRGLDSRLGGQ